VNCFEQGNELILDYCAANDHARVDQLYLDYLRIHGGGTNDARPTLRRCTLNLQTGVHQLRDSGVYLELPTINYRRHNMHDYRYCYGVGFQTGIVNDLDNQIVKLDVTSHAVLHWYHPGFYPGEPLFVARPDAAAEDDGVLLSVVLDSHRNTSFLLVLNARDLTEIARADVPQHIPFGFHGMFQRASM